MEAAKRSAIVVAVYFSTIDSTGSILQLFVALAHVSRWYFTWAQRSLVVTTRSPRDRSTGLSPIYN